jgi:hypothetical protein
VAGVVTWPCVAKAASRGGGHALARQRAPALAGSGGLWSTSARERCIDDGGWRTATPRPSSVVVADSARHAQQTCHDRDGSPGDWRVVADSARHAQQTCHDRDAHRKPRSRPPSSMPFASASATAHRRRHTPAHPRSQGHARWPGPNASTAPGAPAGGGRDRAPQDLEGAWNLIDRCRCMPACGGATSRALRRSPRWQRSSSHGRTCARPGPSCRPPSRCQWRRSLPSLRRVPLAPRRAPRRPPGRHPRRGPPAVAHPPAATPPLAVAPPPAGALATR